MRVRADHEDNEPLRDHSVHAKDKEPGLEPQLFIINCLGAQGSAVFYTIWFLILLTTHITEVVMSKELLKSHCFYTNITMLVTATFCITNVFYIKSGAKADSCLFHVTKALFAISATIELVVISFYWGVIAKTVIPEYEETCPNVRWCYIFTVISHGFVIIPPWSLLLFGWVNLRIADFAYPTLYTTFYIFCVLYPYTTNVGNLYAIMTFDTTKCFVLCAALVIYSSVVFFLVYWIYSCRAKKLNRITPK